MKKILLMELFLSDIYAASTVFNTKVSSVLMKVRHMVMSHLFVAV